MIVSSGKVRTSMQPMGIMNRVVKTGFVELCHLIEGISDHLARLINAFFGCFIE